MNQILECVPNFSEGRDLAKVEKICDCFRGKEGVDNVRRQVFEFNHRAVFAADEGSDVFAVHIVDCACLGKILQA